MSNDIYTKALADIKKYTDNVDDALVQALSKNYAIVMRKKDTASVACTDPAELDRVRTNFLKKKLGLTDDDAKLDKAIKEVCDEMSATRIKSRITFYYLLAKKYGKESVFV